MRLKLPEGIAGVAIGDENYEAKPDKDGCCNVVDVPEATGLALLEIYNEFERVESSPEPEVKKEAPAAKPRKRRTTKS